MCIHNSTPPLIMYNYTIDIRSAQMPPAECIINFFVDNFFFSSAIQRINGASLKETLGSTAKSGIQTAVLTTSARY